VVGPERRVLLFVATRKDADVSRRLLASAGISSHVCPTPAVLSAEIRAGAAAILATDELLEPGNAAVVREALEDQAEWSDLPVVLLMPGGAGNGAAAGTLQRLTSVIVLERPTAMRSVLSAVQAALRARWRQYETRAHIEAIKAAEAKAVHADRAKNDFIAALSHELRTPLTPVLLTASEAANDPATTPHARRAFRSIVKNIELEARLIDDLLDLNRIAHGKLKLELRPADVLPVLHDAIATVRTEFAAKKLQIDVRVDLPEVVVACDLTRMQQVFWNVLRNAAKFTSPGGTIAVQVSRRPKEGEVEIAVVDSGIGMEPPEIESAFDAFAQGSHATRDGPHRFGGLGLGLAISRSLVEMHAGRITAESDGRGLGSTFRIVVPFAAGFLHSPPLAAKPGRGPVRRLRILLVEDHDPSREALRSLLTLRGHGVQAAASIADARALAASGPFDLLMTDIGLPDGSGYDLLQELGSSENRLAVALTGYGMEEDVTRSKGAGFFSHVTKPLRVQELDELLHAVAAALPGDGVRATV